MKILAFIAPQIVQENDMLLSSGLWGLGSLFYVPPSDGKSKGKGQIWAREFHPFQLANVDIEYFKRECRNAFTTAEWIDLIVSSMGFNHLLYSERQKILLISSPYLLSWTTIQSGGIGAKGNRQIFRVWEHVTVCGRPFRRDNGTCSFL